MSERGSVRESKANSSQSDRPCTTTSNVATPSGRRRPLLTRVVRHSSPSHRVPQAMQNAGWRGRKAAAHAPASATRQEHREPCSSLLKLAQMCLECEDRALEGELRPSFGAPAPRGWEKGEGEKERSLQICSQNAPKSQSAWPGPILPDLWLRGGM